MVNLKVSISKLKLKTPIILASGVLGSSYSTINRVIRETRIGAIVTKSFTWEPRVGYNTPIVAYTKAGIVNAVGLTNPGYRALKEILSNIVKNDAPIVVSIAASTPKEYAEIASFAEENGADAVELNLSCPHVKGHGLEIGQDPEYVGKIVHEVRSVLKIPVIVKLGLTDRIVDSALKAEKAGADAVSAINSIRSVVIDVYARKPILSNIYGGLSGPAIHPIAVRVVFDLYKNIEIPIIGIGGVTDWVDAVEFFLAGASAVAIASVIAVKGLKVIDEIIKGIEEYMDKEGFQKISELVGLAHGN
ncbi:MAG: dihydroorotate dehydrogenase [Thermoprotei archaeon]|nr:MAG: dihydroorotate dehydrogenase [Thermoprotei archaeon]